MNQLLIDIIRKGIKKTTLNPLCAARTFTFAKGQVPFMNSYYRIRIIAATTLLCLSWACIRGQNAILPGDANNNGRVDYLDLLHTGYAYGSIGPVRLNATGGPTVQGIPLLWPAVFPDGVNYAYADADGNGVVDWHDLLATFLNYGVQLDSVEEVVLQQGIPGVDARLGFQQSSSAFTIFPGDMLELPILLEFSPNMPAAVNGLAFRLEFDDRYFEQIAISTEDSWMTSDDGAFVFQTQPYFTDLTSTTDVAITRFGQNPVTGIGPVAKAGIIIEDDLIGLLITPADTIETFIRIKDVLVKDGEFGDLPIVTDSIRIVIRHPESLVRQREPQRPQMLHVFPNPTAGTVWISSPQPLLELALYNNAGQLVAQESLSGQYSRQWRLEHLPSGMYVAHGRTEGGIFHQRIIISHHP